MQGALRLCIESKPCEEHVTDAARAKCRVLRDATLTRVLFLVGHHTRVRWLDMGPVGTGEEAEVWYDDFGPLAEALGLLRS